jgi:glycosyltransferase involved in cell wall biosynthesis
MNNINSNLEKFFRRLTKNHIKNDSSINFEKPKTILLIDNDGLSHYTSYLARGLSKNRDIILYGYSKESYIVTGAAKENRIKFHHIEEKLPKKTSLLITIVSPLFLSFIILRALTKTKYDIVHIQGSVPTFFLFLPFLKLKGKKIFWTIHDINIFPYSKGIRGKAGVLFETAISQPNMLLKFTDKIIVHGLILKQHLESRGVDGNKIHVIPHFDYRYLLKSDNQNLRELNNNRSLKEYVLFFGDIAPWKGIDILINAARIVKKRIGTDKFNVLIAGKAGGGDFSYFNGLSKEDHEYIHTHNKHITSLEIPDLLRKARFLVLPYTIAFKDSVSGVIPLAYTFSKPVIVSSVESLAEYVEHNKTGFIFETGDSTQLANYMIQLLQNSSMCAEMGKRAYQKMLHEMSLEKCCETLNNLYNVV